MNLVRAKELLNNVVDNATIADDTPTAIRNLLNLGFTNDELVHDFAFSEKDVGEVEGHDKTYYVKITETSTRIVPITLEEIANVLGYDSSDVVNDSDAVQAVSNKWHNSEIILDADDFVDVNFTNVTKNDEEV